MSEQTDPYKFSKELYWERKKKGLHGTVHPPGSKEQRYDTRVMKKKAQKDYRGKFELKRGIHERKNK